MKAQHQIIGTVPPIHPNIPQFCFFIFPFLVNSFFVIRKKFSEAGSLAKQMEESTLERVSGCTHSLCEAFSLPAGTSSCFLPPVTVACPVGKARTDATRGGTDQLSLSILRSSPSSQEQLARKLGWESIPWLRRQFPSSGHAIHRVRLHELASSLAPAWIGVLHSIIKQKSVDNQCTCVFYSIRQCNS